MSDFNFLYELHAADGEHILTQSVTGSRMGTMLEHIAKTVNEHGKGTTVHMLKARLDENTVLVEPKKMESISTLVTMAVEHYTQKAGTLVIENTFQKKGKLIENLKKVLSNPKKAAKLMEVIAAHPQYQQSKPEKSGSPFKTPPKGCECPKDGTADVSNFCKVCKSELKKRGLHERYGWGTEPKQKPAKCPDCGKSHDQKKPCHSGALPKGFKGFDEAEEEKEKLDLPSLETGDTLLVGKFKNRKAEIKGFGTDEHNQPTADTNHGEQKIFKPRIAKLMPGAEPEPESVDEASRGQVAASVRANKDKHPEKYCHHRTCLWRKSSGPCPKHDKR